MNLEIYMVISKITITTILF